MKRTLFVTLLGAGAAFARTAAADPAADRPTDVAPAADWDVRQRALDEGATRTGGSGLLRLENATGVMPGQIRIGLVTEAFSAGFLCSPQYPCANPRGGAAITSSTTGHGGAILALGAGLAKLGPGVVEAYLSSGALMTNDPTSARSTMPAIGDTILGARYGASVTSGLSLGGTLEGRMSGEASGLGPDLGSTSIRLGGIATGDLRPAGAPVRLGLNLGYSFDDSAHALAQTESARGAPVSRVERFAMNANRVDHTDLRFGGEALLANERVRPFVEYGVLVPVNRQGYQCHANNASGDGCLANTTVVPSTLSLGARFLPWKHGFSVLAALDVGITGTGTFIEELAPVAPWMVQAGLGWSFDLQDPPPVVREVKVEIPAATPPSLTARLRGTVHDRGGAAIANARLRWADRADLFPLSTNEKGEFGADLVPGEYTLAVEADGHAPGSCAVHVARVGSDSTAECVLVELPKKGTLVVVAHDAESGALLPATRVDVVDGAGAKLELVTDDKGAARFEDVVAGPAKVVATSDKYLVNGGATEIAARETTRLEWTLRARPDKSSVTIQSGKIKIAKPLTAESFGTLAELADALVRHPEITKVEVQAHSDAADVASRAKTQEQADAVRAWLVAHGVAEDRVSAKGFGGDRPLVPNVTAGNRARNRRIEVVVVDGGAK